MAQMYLYILEQIAFEILDAEANIQCMMQPTRLQYYAPILALPYLDRLCCQLLGQHLMTPEVAKGFHTYHVLHTTW
jgi:hypothetical protein